MMTKPKPLIAISCGTNIESPHNREFYEIAVKNAGGEAVFVPPRSNARDLVTQYDGLIIPGGNDIDPSRYGERVFYRIIPEESARIDFEFSILRGIIGQEKPVLGICYGMQLINVFFQGSLYQDIRSQVPQSLDHASGGHCIIIGDNPLFETGEVEVNSSHHQAIRQTGRGLKPFAESPDNIVEAFYGEGHRFMVGVQWHPEKMQNSLSTRLFERLIEACRV